MSRLCLVLACLLFAADAHSQVGSEPSAEHLQVPTFRTGVDLVALNVVVTNSADKLVGGLTADRFAVYEDGVQQDVSFFAASEVPLDLAILLDTSASMSDKLATAQQAAIGFASTLRTGDRVTVVDIKDATKVLLPLGDDLTAASDAIRATTARGGTALYNGIYMTLKELVKQRGGNGEVRRQAIAILSDGADTASLVNFDDVMDVAKESGIAIYTITLKSRGQVRTTATRHFSDAEFAMKALAQETGGKAFFPTVISELATVYTAIADELAGQYALGYMSKNSKRDGAFRRIVVRVIDSPGARTRTRSGYLAARPERVSASR